MRNVMITTIAEDYVLVAPGQGSARRGGSMFTYAARNAILPNIAGFALSLGFVVAGALVMEIVFSYPGIGLTLYNAVTSDDYPLLAGHLPRDLVRGAARVPARRHRLRLRRPARADAGGVLMSAHRRRVESGSRRATDAGRRRPCSRASAAGVWRSSRPRPRSARRSSACSS